MADNNVFILFEEIKTALKGINGKLEALPKVACGAISRNGSPIGSIPMMR